MSNQHSEQLNPSDGGDAVERLLWLVFGDRRPDPQPEPRTVDA